MGKFKFLGGFLILALSGGGVYWYTVLRPAEEPAAAATAGQPPGGWAVPVEAAPVQVGTMTRAVEAVGTLRANESVIVRPEVEGRIQKIHFVEGQRVERGVPLVTLETSIYQAELDQAEARLGLSRTNNQRIASLRRQGLGTEQELDRVLSELRVSQAAVALARARLEKLTITAPFDGVLGLRRVSVGDYVSPGQDIVNLLNLDPIKVDFRVPEVFLADIRAGQTIEVRVDAFPGETFTGQVYAIDPLVNVNGRSLVLRARLPNPDRRLQAGLFARVDLILERHENALLIPEEALIPKGDRQQVFTIVDGKAVLTEVTIGRRQAGQVEVIGGLDADAMVVTAGQNKIHDGMAVAPVNLSQG